MASPSSEADAAKDAKIPKFKSFIAPSSGAKSTHQSRSSKPPSSISKSEESSNRRNKSRPHDDEHRRRDRSRGSPRRRDDRGRHERHRSDDNGSDIRHKKPHDRERSSERHRKRRHRSRSRSRSPKPKDDRKLTLQSTQDPTILPWEVQELPYQVDTRGDPHNITYGTIHRYNIPKYWRYGRDRIVGLGRSMIIESDKGDGKGVVVGKTGGRGDGRVRGWEYALEESRPLRVRIDPGDKDNAFVEGSDFVEFPQKTRKRKRELEEEPVIGPNYRSIEGVQKDLKMDEDSDLEAVSSEDESGIFDSDVKERTIYLSRLVDAEPQNIDAWFSWMAHQEVVIYGNKEKRRRKIRQGERQGLEEVKLGILEKAMSKNPGDSRLILEYMRIGTRIWDPSKVKSKWDDILSDNATMIELWDNYINFRQTDFVSFKYRECLKVYEDCVQRLRRRLLRFGATDDEKSKLEDILLYILIRSTTYMRDAGYSEISTAIWQGLLEMNSSIPRDYISGPDSLAGYEAMLESFGVFWDGEVLRIGEPKSQGWAAYVDEDIGDFPEPRDLPEQTTTMNELSLSDPDFFGAWFDKERASSRKLPARTTDEIEEDDPFQVILFSDIREFLWKFQTSEVRSKIGDAFITFSGIVAPVEYQRDSYLRIDLARTKEILLATWFWHDSDNTDVKLITWVDGAPMEPERRGRIAKNPFIFRSNSVPLCPETLFPSTWWFHGVEIPNDGGEGSDHLITVLKEYVYRVPDERLALLYFAIEFTAKPKNNKKVAKQLLKRYSHSLRLWNAYAMSEVGQGNNDAAKAVYQTALKMSTGFTSDQKIYAIELWRSWIWSEVVEGNEESALALILAIPDGHGAVGSKSDKSATSILRSLRFLEEQQHKIHSLQNHEITLAYAELRSLLHFLMSREKGPVVFLQPLEDLKNDLDGNIHGGCVMEQLYMSKSRLLYHYALTAKPYKAADFREFLQTAILGFPDNTAFLSLFAWNESRSKIEYRIRTMMTNGKSHKDQDESVIKWVFMIWVEMQMSAGRMMNPNTVRSLFEKAVESERTKSSVQIWMLYLQFEVRQTQPRRAKDVFFRAVRACPWSKDIILNGFKFLRSVFDFGEMRKVYGVMQEKELRIHVEIEEMLEDWDRKAMGAGGGRGQIIGRGIANQITLPEDEDSDIEGV